MEKDSCPKCDNEDYDGHCFKCGYQHYEPSGIQVEKQCSKCGKTVKLWKFYGETKTGENGKKFKCDDCSPSWYVTQEYRDEWSRVYGYLKSDPKRINQKRNFERWCEGERVA